MTVRPMDMLQIQSAIDDYERKYPRRPAPTAEQALAWRLGKRKASDFLNHIGFVDPASARPAQRRRSVYAEPAPRRIRLGWFVVRIPRFRPALDEDAQPAVQGVVRVGWWGALAVGTASVFVLGAFVGGFK